MSALESGGQPKPDRLLGALLVWTTLLTGILFWLPLVRGLVEGSAYRWDLGGGIGGRGTGGDYWVLVVGIVFAFALLYLGRRGAPLPFHALLLSLHLPLATAVTWTALTRPEEFRFEGASLGVDISLAWLGPALFGGFAILALWWVVRDVRRRRVRTLVPWSWTRLNAIRLTVIAVLFPVEAMLLRGELGSVREAAGVAVTVSQWFILNRALNPPRSPRGALGSS